MKQKTHSSLAERVRSGQVVIGGWIQIPHPAVASLLATSGLDWVALDVEHGMVGIEAAAVLFKIIRDAGSVPLVRLAANVYAETKRFLDAGAGGVIAPLVNCREDAEELVRASKYPPEGERGVGFCPANLYGFSFDEYMKRANAETLTCVQIEHAAGIKNLDEILSVPGVDAAFIGPYDLSASLGITARFDDRRYLSALRRFLAGCRKRNVAPGIHVVQPNPEEVAERIAEGFRMIAYSLDVTLLGTACREGVKRIRELVSRKVRGR